MIKVTDAVVEEFKEAEQIVKQIRLFRYYGMHQLANAYLGFPKWFPIDYLCYLEHGISYQTTVIDPRLEQSRGELVLLNNESRQKMAEKYGKKNIYLLGPLFILYRMQHNIQQDKDAKGTVCYPAHSTVEIDAEFDWDKYARELSELPAEYQPISACIYWKDVLAGRHTFFEKYGIPCYTNGHPGTNDYAHNFYALMKRHKYATSNFLGSYSSYAIEMDIPFFLYGDANQYKPKNDRSNNMSIVNAIVNSEFFIDVQRTFWTDRDKLIESPPTITKEQLEFHDFLVDKKNWIAPSKLRWIILLKAPFLLTKKVLVALFKKKSKK